MSDTGLAPLSRARNAPAPTRLVRIGMLPRAIREDLYSMHAMYSEPEAIEAEFYRKRVPVREIDLTDFNPSWLCKMDDSQPARLRQAMQEDPMLRYMIISDEKLIDGWHRVSTKVLGNERKALALDFSGLVDTRETGFVFPVRILTARPESAPSPGM